MFSRRVVLRPVRYAMSAARAGLRATASSQAVRAAHADVAEGSCGTFASLASHSRATAMVTPARGTRVGAPTFVHSRAMPSPRGVVMRHMSGDASGRVVSSQTAGKTSAWALLLASVPALYAYGHVQGWTEGSRMTQDVYAEEFYQSPVLWSRKKLAQEAKRTGRVLCSFQDGIYDMTDFVAHHPGGSVIAEASGGPVEPHWSILRFHYNNSAVKQAMKEYRIGTLTDPVDHSAGKDPYEDEIKERSKDPNTSDFIVYNKAPFNAERQSDELAVLDFTPQQVQYVRNHSPVPLTFSPTAYRLSVLYNEDVDPLYRMTLEDLKSHYAETEVVSAWQCAGNRRSTMPSSNGTMWVNAVANARFKGIRLRDVVDDAIESLPKDAQASELVVRFEGHDAFNTAIPVDQIPAGALLAWEVNGEPFDKDHGPGLRLIMPGKSGFFWVKMPVRMQLIRKDSIDVSDGPFEPVDVEWQRALRLSKSMQSYLIKHDGVVADFAHQIPVQSKILSVKRDGRYAHVHGYALVGGGIGIDRVYVSVDDGKTWEKARVREVVRQPKGQQYAWVKWRVTYRVREELAAYADDNGRVKVLVRAVDNHGNTQPRHPSLNDRGLNGNGWDSADIEVAM